MSVHRRIYDVTMPVSPSLPVWPGDPPVEVKRLMCIEEGAPYNLSRLSLSTHAGTHVDAPAHFLAGGSSVERLPLEVLLGEAVVVDVSGEREITAEVLERGGLPLQTQRLLMKTGWRAELAKGGPVEAMGFPVLTFAAAHWLTARGVRLVGIESPSVEHFAGGDAASVHKELLRCGIVIVEGLDLSLVQAGRYWLACLPLRLIGGDGAPARVVLIKDIEGPEGV